MSSTAVLIQEPNWGLINFRVDTAPVYAKLGDTRIKIQDRRAIVRFDNDQVLALVSDRYRLVQHKDVFEPMHRAVESMGIGVNEVKTSVALSGAFARVEWVLSFSDTVNEVDDRIYVSLIGRNSYDKSSKLALALGGLRVKTNTGLISPWADHEIGWRHWRTLSLQEIIEEFQKLLRATPEMFNAWKRWAEIPINSDQLARWLDSKGSVSRQYIGDRGKRIILDRLHSQLDYSVWGGYNAIAFFAAHHLRGHDMDKIPFRRDKIARLAKDFAFHASGERK